MQSRLRNPDSLKNFPKFRNQLPAEYREIFQKEYKINREGQSFANKIATTLEGWMHRQVAKLKSKGTTRILELGAGTLNHLAYEVSSHYDIIEPNTELYKDKQKELEKVHNIYQDIQEVPDNGIYDRIISIAVLEHLENLPAVLEKSGQLLSNEGVFQAGVPSEGGFLWWCAWNFGTGVAFKKRTGLDYAPLMQHEHVNTVDEIVDVAKYYYQEVKIRRFPFPMKHLSLYTYIEARKPFQP